MPGKKKKFIDKKNAVTFQLVHRSQHDPLQADEDAPKKVLLPTAKIDEQKAEERKYGVFYEDDYDYLQHLRSVDELYEVEPEQVGRSSDSRVEQESSLKLPSAVFASSTETDVGLLNKAAPHSGPKLDWDPDIVAALDEDFDYDDPENLLEDDFVLAANEGNVIPLGPEEMDEFDDTDMENISRHKMHPDITDGDDSDSEYTDVDSDDLEMSDDDQFSDVGSLGGRSYDDVETKSRFTSYSMTSSVIRRNEGLTLLDDRFEKLYEQYDDTEVGALDHEDIAGCVPADSHILNAVMQEFEQQQKVVKMKDFIEKAEDIGVASGADESDNDEELVKMVEREDPAEKWDCESILSTYSNIYNHPKTIDEVKPIKLNKRTEMPSDSLPNRGLTRKQIEELEHSNTREPPITYRPTKETAEERRARKKVTKDEKRARREEKKANKAAFKDEKRRQEKETLNLRQNLQGIKIA